MVARIRQRRGQRDGRGQIEAVGRDNLADAGERLFGTNQRPDAQCGEAMRFGERPADQDVRSGGKCWIADQRRSAEISVGFVEKDRCVRRRVGNRENRLARGR